MIGLHEAVAALDSGEATSEQLVGEALDRIEAAQPVLGAFRCVRSEAARAEAVAADERRAAGERLPLLGVPVAIKDDMDIEGETTAFGCEGEWPVCIEDGEAVRRLRAAGAVVVGKTTTPEIGQWPFTEGYFGATRNPWDTSRTPGGSSGGSAAAVAAGLVPAALGSDGAGSVRIPAAWNHLVGIKPQRGRISTWPDPEAFNGLTCIGPLARTVRDAALLLDCAAGNHPEDRHQPEPHPGSYLDACDVEPGRLRIALSTRIPFSGAPAKLDPRVEAQVRRLASVLADLGHDVVERDPFYGLVGGVFMPQSMGGIRDWVMRVPDRSLLDPRTHQNASVGRLLGGPLLRVARAAEPLVRAHIGAVFRSADVVLSPTTAQPPFPVGATSGLSNWETDKVVVGACPYAWPWNVIGFPGVNVPAGLTPEQLPVGASLIGPANSEPLLLSLAAQVEEVERWHEKRPPVPSLSA